MNEQIKILCVDDESNVLSALRRVFIDEDYDILVANSAQEGLSVLENEPAQIIISDYRMPGMNGVEFLKEVYRRWPQTMRIVLSGYADSASIVSAINEGRIYKFVSKPWNDDELKLTVSNAVERYFLFKRNAALAEELKRKNEELLLLNIELQKLLEEKTDNLEFSTQVLSAHQNILDSMPVGIVGIDFNDMVVLCNSGWISASGTEWDIIGQNVLQVMPQCVIKTAESVKNSGKYSENVEINGYNGRIIGSLLNRGDNQKAVIIVFVPEGEIL